MLAFLGKLHSVRYTLGMCEWSSIIQYTVEPYGLDGFWDGATLAHKRAMLLYLAHALESSSCHIDSSTRLFLIHTWVRALLEYDFDFEVAHLGTMLSMHPATAFLLPQDPELEALLTQDSVTLRMKLAQHLLETVHPTADLLDKLDKVLCSIVEVHNTRN